MKLAALIFDVDGTLAETERDGHRVAFNEAFKQKGLSWQWDVKTYGDLLKITGGKERIRHYVETYNIDKSSLPESLDTLIPNLHKAKTDCFVSMVAEGKMPFKTGVTRLFELAKKDQLKLAIATTTTLDNITALIKANLGSSGLNLFDIVAAGDIVANKKPAADIYDYVLQQLDLHPDECLAFEDSHNGLLSATGAKLTTIVTPSFYTQSEDFSMSPLVLDSFGDEKHKVTVLKGEDKGKDYLDIEWMQSLLS